MTDQDRNYGLSISMCYRMLLDQVRSSTSVSWLWISNMPATLKPLSLTTQLHGRSSGKVLLVLWIKQLSFHIAWCCTVLLKHLQSYYKESFNIAAHVRLQHRVLQNAFFRLSLSRVVGDITGGGRYRFFLPFFFNKGNRGTPACIHIAPCFYLLCLCYFCIGGSFSPHMFPLFSSSLA